MFTIDFDLCWHNPSYEQEVCYSKEPVNGKIHVFCFSIGIQVFLTIPKNQNYFYVVVSLQVELLCLHTQ